MNNLYNHIVNNAPQVMGIINLTPDSFYAPSRTKSEKEILTKVEHYYNDGATIIDIGAASSRPGAELITPIEEIKRIGNTISLIRKQFPDLTLSVDTYHTDVAKYAFDEGIHIINDISSGELDAPLPVFCSQKKLIYVAMHMRGNPQNMQTLTDYTNVTNDIICWFKKKLNYFSSIGLNNVIIDPGIGFSKNYQQNFELIKQLNDFKVLEKPILIGISRKSFIYKTLQIQPEEALNATSSLHMLCLQRGASVLRVHDAKEAIQCIQLFKYCTAKKSCL